MLLHQFVVKSDLPLTGLRAACLSVSGLAHAFSEGPFVVYSCSCIADMLL